MLQKKKKKVTQDNVDYTEWNVIVKVDRYSTKSHLTK